LLAPWYRLVGDGDRLLLEHGRSVVVFEGGAVGALLPALLPLLDGSRTVEELVAQLGLPARPAVEQALDLLAANGLLVDGPAAPADRSAADFVAAAYGLAPSSAAARLRDATVGVVGAARCRDAIARLLLAAGVGRVEALDWRDRRPVDLAVVAAGPGEVPALSDWNELALEHELCWLPLRPFDGLAALIGPLVVPRESACWECLLLRLAGHVEYGPDLGRIEAVPLAASSSAPLDAITAGVAAQLALCWIGGLDSTLPGVLHVLETRPALSLSTHTVLRVPRCPRCSSVEQAAPPLPWHEAEPVEADAA
jgi:bacteriocin biosynthesis cyclodehydratase domain-containing protein